MAIEFYKEFGELGYLANYSNHGFYKNGIYYKTVEHYYQSEKYDNEDIRKKIIDASTPKEASIIGRDRNNIRKNNFKDIKQQVMLDGLLEKFRQNKDIQYKLLNTKNEEIMEHTKEEYYWGIGNDYSGKNIIGKLLCETRSIIKKELLDSIINNFNIYILVDDNLDSSISGFLLYNILTKYNIDVKLCCVDTYNSVVPIEVEIISNFNKKFILVDTKYKNKIDNNNILGIITSNNLEEYGDNIINILYSSTSLLVYDLFKDRYEFNELEKNLIVKSVINNTDNFRINFDKEDEKLYNSLLK